MRRSVIGRQSFTGRGALSNPPGRFDKQRLEQVDDGWYVEESPDSIATTVEPEAAREVITRNDSPDVPFEQSINPYRGCEHACIYCMSGDTPILMADGSPRGLAELRTGDAIYATLREGHCRRYVKTRVLAHWSVIKPAWRITLADGTSLTAGGDHRFLSERGWKFVTAGAAGAGSRPYLTLNHRLMGTGAFAAPVPQTADYRRGYLCGMIRGDAHLGTHDSTRNSRLTGRVHQSRLALGDVAGLARTRQYLAESAVESAEFLFQAAGGTRGALYAIRTSARSRVGTIRELSAWPPQPGRAWSAGFLAGIFDAQGSYSAGAFRISSTDPQIIRQIGAALGAFGFGHVLEHLPFTQRQPIGVVRLTGGLPAVLRFLHQLRPAIVHKVDLSGRAVQSAAALEVTRIEPLRAMRLYDITTGTGDFIANGVVSHNCYARPSHAYMGLSPGIDFETRLFYKADAARALEAQLARPGYVPQPIMLGANTDPYQPVERRLRVTRSILEVLTRTRHPVTIITKGALVLRDLDLLTELAQLRLVSVALSITTLDDELKRVMEPRTASPQARLRTLRELHGAGVPCGVLVAPVIPALTDQDLEAILAAAAAAGAQWAGYVLLRLPYEIKDLFREWLEEYFPQRASHIMSLIREMRGGRENDPNFGTRMRGIGPYAHLLTERFRIACERFELRTRSRELLNTALFVPPRRNEPQLRLDL